MSDYVYSLIRHSARLWRGGIRARQSRSPSSDCHGDLFHPMASPEGEGRALGSCLVSCLLRFAGRVRTRARATERAIRGAEL